MASEKCAVKMEGATCELRSRVPAANSSSPRSSLLYITRFIMPRGHKSKRRDKRSQGRGDRQGSEVAQEAVAPTAEAAAAEVEAAAAAAAETATRVPATKAEAPGAEAAVCAAAVGGEEQEEEKESSFSKSPWSAASFSPPLTTGRRSPSAGGHSADGSVVSSRHGSSCFYKLEMLSSVHRKYRDEFPRIFKSVQKQLEAVFAVEVREVESTRHSYSLFSMLSLPNNGRIRPGRRCPKTRLLMQTLALILMKDHRASEVDIWKFLKKMHVYPGKKHIFFGNANRLLTQDFVKLKYLEYRQVPGCLLPRREFLWGPQAHAEISKEKIMQFLIRINRLCPSYFSYLNEDLEREDIEQFQASLSAKRVSTGKPRVFAPALHPVAPAKSINV
ncbi:melanoma-associated antigen B3-like [Cavia porcellus]|uniref:melanoma-associated antigen B3-like n=1 Tax=Cavia porcellus TaxID=10141 RepID=UPI000350FADD|nr:melanoma-associated antigen B3-like [Cavia porcellus]